MKPSKKKSSLVSNKKNANENSSLKIQNFFKVTPKQDDFAYKSNDTIETDHSKSVYIKAVEQKLKCLHDKNNTPKSTDDHGPSESSLEGAVGFDITASDSIPCPELKDVDPNEIVKCVRPECSQKIADFIDLEAKYKELKKLYFTVTSQYTDLHIKYDVLVKAKSHLNNVDVEESGSTDDFFTKNELKFLECMPLDKKKDSTFVLQCLQFVYKNDLLAMRNKSLKGTADATKIDEDGQVETIPGKNAMTPIKVIRIKELFMDRVAKCKVDSVEYMDRISDSNINKLFASGIKNISKKQV